MSTIHTHICTQCDAYRLACVIHEHLRGIFRMSKILVKIWPWGLGHRRTPVGEQYDPVETVTSSSDRILINRDILICVSLAFCQISKSNGQSRFSCSHVTCHMGSRSFICHPTEATLTPWPSTEAETRFIHPQMDERLSWLDPENEVKVRRSRNFKMAIYRTVLHTESRTVQHMAILKFRDLRTLTSFSGSRSRSRTPFSHFFKRNA